MSAWTDGKVHVVVGPAGLSIHRDDGVELLLALAQLGGQLPVKKKGKIARVRPLAVNASTEVVYTVDAERKLVRTVLGAKRSTLKFPWDISALAPAYGQRVFAAYVTGTKARAVTSLVLGTPPADPKGKWEHEFEGDKPQKVEWPEQLLWEKAPWSRKTRWATDPDLLQVDVNAHAYTVYDLASAVVGVLRRPGPKKPPEGFACVLRTPKEKNTTVAASASPRGVVVATCKPDGQAVICEFDDAGKLLAHRELEAKKIAPLTLAGPRIFALVDDRKLLVLGHDLSEQASLELAELPASQVQLRANTDGSAFSLALADKVFLGALEGDQWTLREFDFAGVPAPGKAHETEIAEAEIEEPEEPTGPGGAPLDVRPRIITQAPRLSLNPNQPNDAWNFAAGESFEIVVNAVSVGGAAETGLYVEVSGDALDKGLLEPESVAIEGENAGQASFEAQGKRRVARLPELLIPAGVEPIKDRKVKPKDRFLDNPIDTFLTVRLRGKALKAGSELMFVRVGFEGTEEGSLMRGRPVSIG
jgi:hypothetical protein